MIIDNFIGLLNKRNFIVAILKDFFLKVLMD